MQCKKGINTKKQGIVPCGQCMCCRLNNGKKWASRIQMEALTHWREYSVLPAFVTLTMNDENIDIELDVDATRVYTLRKKGFLKWINNVQRTTGNFRYYAIGEYGDLYHRPHYHMAIFPSYAGQAYELTNAWHRGRTEVTELNHQRAAYLARYTTKRLTQANDPRLLGNQEPEFRASSSRPPLGAAFADDLVQHYMQGRYKKLLETRGDIERTFRHQGRRYPIPSYVLNRARKSLRIPLLHRDRSNGHKEYEFNFPVTGAEQCPDKHHAQEMQLNAKNRRKIINSRSTH